MAAEKGACRKRKWSKNRPFISVGRYGHFRTIGLARRTSYIQTAKLHDFNNSRKIMVKSAFLHENAQYLLDIDLARVSIGKD